MEIYPIPSSGMETQSLGTLLRKQSAQNTNGNLNQLVLGENQNQSAQQPHGCGLGIGELLNCTG